MKKKLILSLLLVFVLLGCGHSPITKGYNTLNAVTSTYNSLPPIYEALIKDNPNAKDDIVKFDAEMNKAILSAYDALIAAKAGTGDMANYDVAITSISEILVRYGAGDTLSDPRIQAVIEVIRKLLEAK